MGETIFKIVNCSFSQLWAAFTVDWLNDYFERDSLEHMTQGSSSDNENGDSQSQCLFYSMKRQLLFNPFVKFNKRKIFVPLEHGANHVLEGFSRGNND